MTSLRPLALDTSHGPRPGWSAADAGPVFRKIIWPRASALRSLTARRRGLHGLGQTEEETSGGPAGQSVAPGPSIWSQIVPGLFRTGEQIALNVTYPSGMVQQTRQGYVARQAPGSFAPLPFGVSASGAGTWLAIGAVVLVGALALSAGRRGRT